MFFFDYLSSLVGILVAVAFFTLFERKFLGYLHFRKGPTKLLYFGILQPISDAVKLFTKELMKGYKISYYFFISGPLVGLFLMMILWASYGSYFGIFGSIFSILYVLCFLSLGVYFFLYCGWGSSSKYSLLGTYRSISQTVSYEVSMVFLILFLVYASTSYDFLQYSFFQAGFWFTFLTFWLFIMWLFTCLAESNRTPFDFSEGESELVSGFNIEYSGSLFSFIFICEYGMIIFFCFMTTILFMGASFFIIKILWLCFFYVWVRCSFPRYRYDLLMDVAWKTILPSSLVLMMLSLGFFF